MAKVTVLMAAHNAGEFLPYSIRSILEQTFQDFIFLIIDDGSTDNTKQIVRGFNDERIKYYKKENSGLGDSLNYGLNLAETELIARMDADDISLPNRLKKQFNFFSSNNSYDVISSWYTMFEDNKILYTVKTAETDEENKKRLALHSDIMHPACMFKKNKILFEGGYKPIVFEDYELWLRIKDKVKFGNIQEELMLIRYRRDSYSRKDIVKKNKMVYDVQEQYYDNSFREKFNLTIEEEYQLRGWREFFYGTEKKAREHWKNLNPLTDSRIFIASIVLLFPHKFILWFKENRMKFRLKYMLNYFSHQNIYLRKFLNDFISSLK